jgi:hypothetical protein
MAVAAAVPAVLLLLLLKLGVLLFNKLVPPWQPTQHIGKFTQVHRYSPCTALLGVELSSPLLGCCCCWWLLLMLLLLLLVN